MLSANVLCYITNLIDAAQFTTVNVDSDESTIDSEGENLLKNEDSTDTTGTDGTTDAANTTNGETDGESVDSANTEGTDGTNLEGTDGTNTEDVEGSSSDSTDTKEGEIIDASGDGSATGDMSGMEGMEGMDGMPMDGGAETAVKDPFLSKPLPVFGISAVTLVVGAIFGIVLAKKKIKKGIDLYED